MVQSWWLMPVILGSQFLVSPGKKESLCDPHLNGKKLGEVVCVCHPS
jgi:hypothetical protein